MDEKDLKNPIAYYRAKPFWSLNGDLSEEETNRQAEAFRKMGFGGAYLHSRTGLVTPYMGEKWLSLIGKGAKKLSSLGLEAYLYDEDRWPSGTCGGKVTEKPEYRLKSLVVDPGREGDFNFFVKFAGDPGKGEMTAYRIAEGERKEEETLVGFSVKEQAKEAFYNGNTYVDLMNDEAVRYFFETTYEKYRESLGDLFGKEICGIFTDEPHRGCFFNGFGQSGEDALFRFPYTGKAFARYRELFGEKIEEKLPEIAFRFCGEEFSRAAYRYTETCLDLFLSAFFKPYRDLCRNYKLKFTGHLLNEDDLAGHALMCGDLAACYYYMDEPGIDNLGSTATHFAAVKTCSSVAEQFGKKRVVSELYGATGWQTPFARYKAIGDWQTMLGINSRCTHLSWYTMKGESKRDYPASISVQSAWWKDYACVEDYFARMSLALSGESLAETLVIHPVESVWGLARLGGFDAPFRAKSELFRSVEQKYRSLSEALVYGGVEFDYGSEILLKANGKVDKQTILLGNKRYGRVVVYGLYSMRRETFELLKEFCGNGGEVIFGGGYPSVVGGEKYEGSFFGEYFGGDERALAEKLKEKQDFPVFSETTEGVISRIKGKSDFAEFTFAVVNTDRENGKTVRMKIKNGYVAKTFDPRTGEVGNDLFSGEIILSLCGTEEKVFFVNRGEITECAPHGDDRLRPGETVKLPSEFAYSLSEPNILVLDRAVMTVKGEGKGEKELIFHDNDLRAFAGLPLRGRNMFQPWFKKETCKPLNVVTEFKFRIEEIPESIDLIGEDLGLFEFSLNGKKLGGKPCAAGFADRCFEKIAIGNGSAKKGENLLRASCVFDGDPALENFYLAGNFGVKTEGSYAAIVRLPDKLHLGNVCEQGLPFYGGEIVYDLPVGKGKYEIKVDYGGATAKVTVSGKNGIKECKMLAFPPYRATFISEGESVSVTVSLSRKNVFGPLHRDVADPPSTVPLHFRLTGEHRREEFVLMKNGLLKAEIRRISK